MNRRIQILLGLLFVGFAIWILVTANETVHQLRERLEGIGYDIQLHARILTHHPAPEKTIAIIDIDDRSLQAEGRWPWPRSKLTKLLDQLKKYGVISVSFDIFFAEKQQNIADEVLQKLAGKNFLDQACTAKIKTTAPIFDEDVFFAKSLANSNSLLAMTFLPYPQIENFLPPPLIQLTPEERIQLNINIATGYISNIPILQQAAKGAGFINVNPDIDGVGRRAMLIMEYNGAIYPALSLITVMNLFGDTLKLITPIYDKTKKMEGIQLGNLTIPTDEHGQVLIPFIGKSHTFPYYSATDILNDKVSTNDLGGKIVIIGTSAIGLGDVHPTAIENLFPSVEVQATLLNGILQNNFSYIPAWAYSANISFVFLFGLIAAILFPYAGPRSLSLIMIFFPLAMLIINNWIWEKTGLVLSVMITIVTVDILALLNIIYGYLFETRKREQLRELFGQYVPSKHIDEMLLDKSIFSLRGENRFMSVLFADIRNFTEISENMDALNLIKILNDFFNPMTEIIFKYDGTIDKYVGDMIMAFWGAPIKEAKHAAHALESALEMQMKVTELRPLFTKNQLPDIKIGIGINSGLMTVGDMGSRFRRNYTVIGDAVNLAARVEELSKFYGVNIVVTEYTFQNQPEFIFRILDKVRVKGRKAELVIYELVCRRSDLTYVVSKELALYHEALEYYFMKKWDDAELLIGNLLKQQPNKKLYTIYLKRIKEFRGQTLPDDWDGVYIHINK